MSLVASGREEFHRSPITVAATVVGVLVSLLALLVAWLQLAGPQAVAPAPPNIPSAPLRLSNLLAVLAFYLANSLSLASATRLLARAHWFAALTASIAAAALSAFGTMLMLTLMPPKALSPQASTTAQDVVLWGTCIVFIALNGLPVLKGIARPSPGGTKEDNDGLAVLLFAIFFLLIWTGLVSAGLSRLVLVFLS